jgi:hypothetical protein
VDVEELGHHERHHAHDRGHEHAARRRDGLDGTGERRPVADTLHHRDRDHASRRDVGRRAAADRAEQPAGHDRDLRGAAAQVACRRHRERDEEASRAGRL